MTLHLNGRFVKVVFVNSARLDNCRYRSAKIKKHVRANRCCLCRGLGRAGSSVSGWGVGDSYTGTKASDKQVKQTYILVQDPTFS